MSYKLYVESQAFRFEKLVRAAKKWAWMQSNPRQVP